MEHRKMTYKSAPQDVRFEGSPCGMRWNSAEQRISESAEEQWISESAEEQPASESAEGQMTSESEGYRISASVEKQLTSAPDGDRRTSGSGGEPVACVPYLSFESFDRIPFLKHGFSTRYGGVSEGFLASMNLGFGRGDTPENLMENYRRMGAAIGFPAEDAVISDQTHTTNLRVVTAEDKGKGLFRPKDYRDVDGLLTAEPGIPLVTLYADCVPLFFVDKTHRAIALSHSGWKGTVNHMAEVTVERMRREFGTEPADLEVAIGPSICQDCYEVTENVIEAFQASFPQEIWKDLFYRKDELHWQLNLWYASYWQFRNAGLMPAQISLPGVCTCCNPDVLYSHRATGGNRGNLGAFLMIAEDTADMYSLPRNFGQIYNMQPNTKK